MLNGAFNNGTAIYACLECDQTVSPRQEAFQCEFVRSVKITHT